MTVVQVGGGACGFTTRIKAMKEGRREVSIELESDCEAVAAFGEKLKEKGPFGLRDVMTKGVKGNPIVELGSATLSHASCSVPVAILKAAEVELGLNIPCNVIVEFSTED
jgi:Family of unknown function (DUF6951)